jgi:hypothetical protein
VPYRPRQRVPIVYAPAQALGCRPYRIHSVRLSTRALGFAARRSVGRAVSGCPSRGILPYAMRKAPSQQPQPRIVPTPSLGEYQWDLREVKRLSEEIRKAEEKEAAWFTRFQTRPEPA